jgi:hypothetical protein
MPLLSATFLKRRQSESNGFARPRADGSAVPIEGNTFINSRLARVTAIAQRALFRDAHRVFIWSLSLARHRSHDQDRRRPLLELAEHCHRRYANSFCPMRLCIHLDDGRSEWVDRTK